MGSPGLLLWALLGVTMVCLAENQQVRDLTNMATVRSFEVISDKLDIIHKESDVYYKAQW